MERVGSGRESGRAARAPTRWRGRQAAPQLVTFHFSLVTAAAGRGGAPAARAGKRLARRARPTMEGGGVEGKGRGWKPHLRKSRDACSEGPAPLPGVRHLAAPGWKWRGRRPHRNFSLVTFHLSLRPQAAAVRPLRGREIGSLGELAPPWSGWGVDGNGRGWKPHLRKWGGSGATSHALLPGVRHLAAPGMGMARPEAAPQLVTCHCGRRPPLPDGGLGE